MPSSPASSLLPLLWLLLLPAHFQLSVVLAKKRVPPPAEPEFRLDEVAEQNAGKFVPGKCAFYCFFVPLKRDELIDLSFYNKLSCSHIVYGWAHVDNWHFEFPTDKDLLPYSYYGNFKLVTSLQLVSSKPRVLLGMKMAPNAKFVLEDNEGLARNVSRRMVFHARRYGFSGIFLKFESNVLLSPGFEQFVELLSDELALDNRQWRGHKLSLVLSISSNWVRYVYRRMPKFDVHFDAFYLWADEIDSAGDLTVPKRAVPVDPLHPSQQVPRADALAENAERLAGTGVARQKIIVGLSAWARSYYVQNVTDQKELPAEVTLFGPPGNGTGQENGKLAFQEICMLTEGNGALLDYDNRSETVSLVDSDLWVSYNEPEHAAFTQKLEWISNHEFGDVGLYSIQADDPKNNCSRGILPLHQSVANRFKCRRGTKRGNSDNDQCLRFCLLNLDEPNANSTFQFEKLQPGWCSHVVLHQALVTPFMPSTSSQGMRRALAMYNDWERERKPFLILAFSATSEQWHMAIGSPAAKFMLIESIRRMLDENNADGVNLDCANGGPDGAHTFQFNAFLSDLRRILGKKKQILVSLHPSSFIENKVYDFGSMVRSVDYFIAIGYRFHRYTSPNTGHHSPLFSASMLNQPKMTIQGMVETMLARDVPKDKLVVAFSAEAMSQNFADDLHNRRSWESRKIGEPAARIYPKNRSNGPGVVSQTTVCEIMKEENTLTYFLNDLGVPYLINNEREFIAFDNKRSIQIKTVWVSLQGLGGVALHGLEMDNVEGICPQGEPFPLLSTIAESQTCIRCNEQAASRAASDEPVATTETPQAESSTVEVAEELPNSMERLAAEAAAKNPEAMEKTEKADGTTPSEGEGSSSTMAPDSSVHCQANKEDGKQEKKKRFAISCALPMAELGKKLALDNLPLEHCDSLLLSGWARLEADGTAGTGKVGEKMLGKLVEMANANGTGLWAEVECGMDSGQWEELIGLAERREQVALALAKLLRNNNLTGLMLDCDQQMQASHRASFSQLLNEINAELMEVPGGNGQGGAGVKDCSSRLALRIRLSRQNISQVYEQEQLNKLLKFVLLPSGIAVAKSNAKMMNPLFAVGIANQESSHTQNGTLASWQGEGLKPGLVLLELPTFGIKQKREDGQIQPTVVGQKEVCSFMRETGAQRHTRYDAVAAYWKTKNEWLSAENGETIKYKVQFAMQHGLGGVLLRSLAEDDPENTCKNEGGFPMLEMAHKARCNQRMEVLNTRLERDMLGNMMLGRGRR